MTALLLWLDGFYRRIGREHKQIARGVLTVAFFAVIGKSVGAAKEMAIAWRYGISPIVDAYLFVFNLAQWPVTLFYGVITAVLVPLSAKIKQEDPGGVPLFRSELFGAVLLIAAILGLLGWLGLPWLVEQPWVGLNASQQTLAVRFAPWFAWVIPFGLVYGLLAAWTMAGNRHINTLLDSLPALGLLIAVLLTGGIAPLIVGILVGFILQPFLLSALLYRRGEIERPVWGLRSPWWRVFWAALTVMLLGQFLQSLTGIIDQFFAAHLGSGELATLGYSNRILALVNAIGAMAIGRALLPVLSQTYARGGSVRRRSMQWAGVFFLLGGGAAALGILFAPEIVSLLFQRGAFGVNDTYRVSRVLRVAFLQMPFYFGGLVMVYALLSQGRQASVAVLAGVNLLVKALFGWFFVVYLQKGLQGLMLSTAIVYLSSFLGAFFLLNHGRKLWLRG